MACLHSGVLFNSVVKESEIMFPEKKVLTGDHCVKWNKYRLFPLAHEIQ